MTSLEDLLHHSINGMVGNVWDWRAQAMANYGDGQLPIAFPYFPQENGLYSY